MEPLQHSAQEIKRLQRCVNDLVSILALPAIWTGGEPSRIVNTLFEALEGMLRLDLVYARLKDPAEEGSMEFVRSAQSSRLAAPPREIGEALDASLGDSPLEWPPNARVRIGDHDLSIVSVRLGLQDELGVIVAGSRRPDFPEQTDSLLLGVAVNQAAIGLQEARLLSEQKRVGRELDQRVAQRTAELAALNQELIREIAERRRVEEALRASEQNSRLIVDSIPAGVAVLKPDGGVETLNRQILEYFGKDLEQLKNLAADSAVHPEDLPHTMEARERSFTTGEPYEVEHRIRGFDGVYRWFQARALPLRDGSGRIVRWYLLLIDIDKRKRAEDALKRSEAFLTEGQHLARVGTFSWRVDDEHITWSDQLYRIFGLERGSPVTLARIGSRVHPEDIPLFADMITRARSNASDFEYEHRLLMPDESVRYVRLVAHGTRDQDGRVEYIGAAQDVTERRLSEEALSQARLDLARVARATSLGMLTASIAHEVNQPLAGIVTNASTCMRMLAADPPNVEGARETAKRTIRDGNRAAELVARLRALFARKEAVREPVDLNEATREVLALSLNELRRNRVVLQPEFAENLPLVTGDRVQLQEVILNLLRNASDAMSCVDDRPRHLCIRTERDDGDQVRVSVQDTGIGLDPQRIDELFQAFYTTKGDGMGIGLSVSRSIIESHHGSLWAVANDGPGATFSFSIPRAPGGGVL